MIYFLEKAIAAAFLTLSSKWWVLSNSKAWYSTANYPENAAVIRDKKNIALTRHARFYPELARKENSQLQEVYPDFTNRFIIRENIKMPCFAYRRFACGEIRFHHEIQISEWPIEEVIRWTLTDEWWMSSSKIERSKMIRKNNPAQSTFERSCRHSNVEHDENIDTLLHHVDLSRCSDEIVTLSEESREVEIYIADYAAKKN